MTLSLCVIASALLLNAFLKLFLPVEGVYQEHEYDFQPNRLFHLSQAFTGPAASASQREVHIKQEYQTIASWMLQAIYRSQKGGFIVVKIGEKSHYLSVGETLQGYRLIKIMQQDALLRRDNQEYRISLRTLKEREAVIKKDQSSRANTQELSEGIVRRDLINDHMAHPTKIWNSIKIRPNRVDGVIEGFIVLFVQKQSVFDALGLQTGDILLSVNGVKLKSFKDAKMLYARVDKMDHVTVSVRRRGTIKELFYEIK